MIVYFKKVKLVFLTEVIYNKIAFWSKADHLQMRVFS